MSAGNLLYEAAKRDFLSMDKKYIKQNSGKCIGPICYGGKELYSEFIFEDCEYNYYASTVKESERYYHLFIKIFKEDELQLEYDDVIFI